MDEEVREPLRKTRLVAWLAAGMLVAGVVSVGAVVAQNEAEDRRVVAAGQPADGVELPTTPGEFVPPLPTTVAAPTTTAAPKPTPTAPPTTQPARTTTTKQRVTATTLATSTPTPTTAPQATGVTVNVVNEHPQAVNVKVNGKAFTLASGQQSGPVTIARSDNGNDTVEATLVQEPSCGTGDADSYFPKAGSYRVTVVADRGTCQSGVPGPAVRVTSA